MTAVGFWRELSELERLQLEPSLARAIAQSWAEAARGEHASVASFSRFSLQLLAVAAPPELVADAHRAALDEIEHARMCFAIAGVFAGEPLGPGPLPLDAHALGVPDLPSAAASAAIEGCIGETLSAHEAEEAARLAEPRAIRSALSVIARDEARHAELAWRFVGWAIGTGGARVREAVQLAVETELSALRAADPRRGILDEELVPYGRLSALRLERVRGEVIDRVIAPALRDLR